MDFEDDYGIVEEQWKATVPVQRGEILAALEHSGTQRARQRTASSPPSLGLTVALIMPAGRGLNPLSVMTFQWASACSA
jgi:hypothetical protein